MYEAGAYILLMYCELPLMSCVCHHFVSSQHHIALMSSYFTHKKSHVARLQTLKTTHHSLQLFACGHHASLYKLSFIYRSGVFVFMDIN